jgi:hypothetical protein
MCYPVGNIAGLASKCQEVFPVILSSVLISVSELRRGLFFQPVILSQLDSNFRILLQVTDIILYVIEVGNRVGNGFLDNKKGGEISF